MSLDAALKVAVELNFVCRRCSGFLRTYGYPHKQNNRVFWCPNKECIKAREPILEISKEELNELRKQKK